MFSRHHFRHSAWVHVCVCMLLLTGGIQAHGQEQELAARRDDCERQYKPSTGQPGKDVVWVPTNDGHVTRMLELAAVNSNDLVYDLGAGDGKIAIAAAKRFGAKSVGVEYNPDLVKLAQCLTRAEGVADRVTIIQGDIFETDFSTATVVTLYLLPELNVRLRPTILKMRPGTRVVSHSFLMDEWDPDGRARTDHSWAFLWIVPAQVAGKWTFSQQDGKDRFDVQLDQAFQQISGSVGERNQPLTDGKLSGPQISLTFSEADAPTRLVGHVDGDRIEAKVTRNGSTSDYVGTRQ